jgi:hypothetical protein
MSDPGLAKAVGTDLLVTDHCLLVVEVEVAEVAGMDLKESRT